MFGRKKKAENSISYDPKTQRPAMRVSICTGEKVAGFIENDTGRFHDMFLIHDNKDLQSFCDMTGTTPEDLEKIY